MAYNFENVTPYVSTSNQTAANNQMLVSGFQNSMRTFQALEQQRLKENSRKNALIDKDIKDAEAAWNLSVGEARKTGKVVDLDSKLEFNTLKTVPKIKIQVPIQEQSLNKQSIIQEVKPIEPIPSQKIIAPVLFVILESRRLIGDLRLTCTNIFN